MGPDHLDLVDMDILVQRRVLGKGLRHGSKSCQCGQGKEAGKSHSEILKLKILARIKDHSFAAHQTKSTGHK
ncbi:hypothetical protein AA0535_1027 [Asaia krungthepensis NRIC 0535]|uniref:Uncharacterized protein n=1 Tax=Asaia krungthepensis NRIC 0535 TaxID=1307925 RepID=A0ABQ0Q0X8_9PROT|nr:hypothetical protein AA0535_1027 [Asaia krungthepensis NRIC 0535]